MSAVRASLVGVVAAAALTVAGCKDETATTARSVQALSPQTVALMQEKGMSRSDPMLLRIYKEESKAEVWKKRKADGKYALLKSYDICRFSGKLGPKIKEGDKQAPEGFYSVAPAQMNPKSSYYLSFNLGYPNAYDRALGRTGQHVMMHGDCLSAGCYAMTDAQIAEIYTMARESFAGGQKAFQVQALPFRMTAENMARRRNDPNIAFWKNLKQGSDNFEVTKAEPKVDACGKKYVFNATTGPLSTFEPTAGCPSYQVQPQIAKAVAVKERTDNILIAQLSKSVPAAPEYLAQNGRLRRSLDEPIVQVAAVAPPVVPSYASAEGGAAVMGQTMGAPGPMTTGATTVALHTPAKASSTAAPAAQQVASVVQVPTAPAMKPEGNLFTRMFRGEEPQAPVVVEAAPAAPVAAASPAPRMVAFAKPVRREIAPQAPVMASSFAPTASEPKPEGSGIGGWVRSVGGLFGGKSEEAAPAGQPMTLSPTSVSQPTAAPKPRDRSARLPEAFKPQAKLDPRVTSAFAAFE